MVRFIFLMLYLLWIFFINISRFCLQLFFRSNSQETKHCIGKVVSRLAETSSLPTRLCNRFSAIFGWRESSDVPLQATTMKRKQDKWTAQASPFNVSEMCPKASKTTGLVSDNTSGGRTHMFRLGVYRWTGMVFRVLSLKLLSACFWNGSL